MRWLRSSVGTTSFEARGGATADREMAVKVSRILIGAIALGLATGALAGDEPRVQPVQVDPARPDWENPAVFARNKLPAHARKQAPGAG